MPAEKQQAFSFFVFNLSCLPVRVPLSVEILGTYGGDLAGL